MSAQKISSHSMETMETIDRSLNEAGLDPTPLRREVLLALVTNKGPMPVTDILEGVRHRHSINKVTLYRILDLCVDRKLVKRVSAGDRSFRYCAGPLLHGPTPHCHFYCIQCGSMQCIPLRNDQLDLANLRSELSGHIRDVDLRIDGICDNCAE